ncbi:hypothetical protein [Streptomyces sp. NPDC050428]|uniref:hypothetical protein n=1 Tax=Streptomyces sp. NPDC050428 TaxID=3155757 RepID=UPI00341E3490
MTPDAILALYRWVAADCFRCGRARRHATRLDVISTPSGHIYELHACGHCVLELEEERQIHAERCGAVYRPGTLGA